MGQDSNAANEGDQLKHALLAEVLVRCLDWPSLTYAETHAGAGVYDSAFQPVGKDYIQRLKKTVESEPLPHENDAGRGYLLLLKNWWSNPENPNWYPGSVLQAAITMKRRRDGTEPVEFRVTEAIQATHSKLVKKVDSYGVNTKLSGFQDEIKWLTENDSLVILIDPYTYTNEKSALNKGHIDLETLTMVLKECWTKSTCVVGFWCAMGRDKTAKQKQTHFTSMVKSLASRNGAIFRLFAFGKYSIAWIGIGQGASVVRSMPSSSSWKQSWLKRVVKEQSE